MGSDIRIIARTTTPITMHTPTMVIKASIIRERSGDQNSRVAASASSASWFTTLMVVWVKVMSRLAIIRTRSR
jgi:hypothetical protein